MPSEPKVTSFPVEAPRGEICTGTGGDFRLSPASMWWLSANGYLQASLSSRKACLPLPPGSHAERPALSLPSPAHGSVLAHRGVRLAVTVVLA